MKDNIFSIHNDLKEGKTTWKEAEKKLFILFDVVVPKETLSCPNTQCPIIRYDNGESYCTKCDYTN
jgi:hypothetical protein